MWQNIFGVNDAALVPIGHVTNGVHAHSWVSPEVDELLRDGVHGVWDGADDATWARAYNLSHERVWSARSAGRSRLVNYVRARRGADVLDPNILTIGFARRFATYKRATLLLAQPDRLRRLLLVAAPVGGAALWRHQRPEEFEAALRGAGGTAGFAFAQQVPQKPLTQTEYVKMLYVLEKNPSKKDELVEAIRKRGIGFELTDGLRGLTRSKGRNTPL